jgi:GxxExxY protein
MAIEMEKQGLRFARELKMSVFYEGIQVGTRRVDYFVEDKIMTELKEGAHLDDTNFNQAINYLEAYNLPVGLLLNFGSRKLEFKRTYNTKHPDNAEYVKKQG